MSLEEESWKMPLHRGKWCKHLWNILRWYLLANMKKNWIPAGGNMLMWKKCFQSHWYFKPWVNPPVKKKKRSFFGIKDIITEIISTYRETEKYKHVCCVWEKWCYWKKYGIKIT